MFLWPETHQTPINSRRILRPRLLRRRYHALTDACAVTASASAQQTAGAAQPPPGADAPSDPPPPDLEAYLFQAVSALRAATGAGPPGVPSLGSALGGSDGGLARALDGVPGWLAALNLARPTRTSYPHTYPHTLPTPYPNLPTPTHTSYPHSLSLTHARANSAQVSSRIWFDAQRSAAVAADLEQRFQTKLSRLQRPPFIGPVTVRRVAVPAGGNPPRLTDLRLVPGQAHPAADLLASMRGPMPCFEARADTRMGERGAPQPRASPPHCCAVLR